MAYGRQNRNLPKVGTYERRRKKNSCRLNVIRTFDGLRPHAAGPQDLGSRSMSCCLGGSCLGLLGRSSGLFALLLSPFPPPAASKEIEAFWLHYSFAHLLPLLHFTSLLTLQLHLSSLRITSLTPLRFTSLSRLHSCPLLGSQIGPSSGQDRPKGAARETKIALEHSRTPICFENVVPQKVFCFLMVSHAC